MEYIELEEKIFEVPSWNYREEVCQSHFDNILRKSWSVAMTNGYFLHRVESIPKRIPGTKGFTGLLCAGNRPKMKRKAQSFKSIKEPLNEGRFNFTKIPKNERLFIIKNGSQSKSSYDVSVIINNSPYEFGHVLFVPKLNDRLNQVLNLDAIKLGITVLLSSNHPGFRMMYNSLCAGASVNHLHMHGYYTEYWLCSEVFNLIPMFNCQYNHDTNGVTLEAPIDNCYTIDSNDSVVRGFAFTITKDNHSEKLPTAIYKVISYLLEHEIAHNVVFLRGVDLDHNSIHQGTCNTGEYMQVQPGTPRILDDTSIYGCKKNICPGEVHHLTGRIYIFPRKASFEGKDYTKFLVNVTELFGHLYFGDRRLYDTMSETDVVNILQSVSFNEDNFMKLKSSIKEILLNSNY